MIITIDGASGTGKSTVAKRLSRLLHFTYFETGAMFRALAFGVIAYKIDPHDKKALAEYLLEFPVSIHLKDGQKRIFLKDQDVTDKLYELDVTSMGSKIATIEEVRQTLANLQRSLAKGVNSIFDGRDMGTVIFPQAEVKIFLTAKPEIQAKRRYLELIAKKPELKETLTQEKVLQDILERDLRDSTRALAPLKPADDAIIIDTSDLSIDEVVEQIVQIVRKKESGTKPLTI